MSNRPDWSDAPYWAQYLAQDSSGEWYWYEHEPFFKAGKWHSDSKLCDVAPACIAEDSLETRETYENDKRYARKPVYEDEE